MKKIYKKLWLLALLAVMPIANVVAQNVAKIGDTEYATLEAAVAAATTGQTITLLADVDLSSHARSASDDIILEGVTLDLNRKTIRGFNSGVRYSGNNAVIKNGTFDFVAAEPRPNYGLSIGSYTDGATVSDNMVLEDLTVVGGINIDLANVTLNNVNINMNQSTFYAIWVDEDGSNATFNSGTINAGSDATAVFGVAQKNASLKIAGGTINTNGEKFRLENGYMPVEVSGGVFDTQVPEDCCAAGFIPQDNGNGTYGVKEGAFVAQIGTAKYETLAEAIAAVPTDGTATTITMIADETVATEGTLTVVAGKNIVLDLNGKTVSGSNNNAGNFYFITNKGTLEVTDNSANHDGKITFASSKTDFSNERVTIYNFGGTLTLTNGTVENTSAGGMAYAIKNSSNAWGEDVIATFNLNGGTVSAPNGDAALRVYQNVSVGTDVAKNYVNINGGTIEETGIFVDTYLYTTGKNLEGYTGSNIDTKININGGTVKGLIDMKIRHPFNTLLNITGGDLSNTQMWVRKYAGEYASDFGEPTAPMVTISGGTFDFKTSNNFGLAYGYAATTWTSYTKPFEISGGTYDLPVQADYCADGYAPTTIAQGEYGVEAITEFVLYDGTPYTYTTDVVVSTAKYVRSFDSTRVKKYQGWFVPFDYTITAADLQKFKFFKINMIAHSATEGSTETTDPNKLWIHLIPMAENGVLKANTPYIFTPQEVATDYEFTTTNATLKALTTGSVASCSTMTEEFNFYGVYSSVHPEDASDIFYYMAKSGQISRATKTSTTVGANRWIFRVTPKDGSQSSVSYSIGFVVNGEVEDDDVTAVSSAAVEAEGEVVGYYTLNGQKVSEPTKGVYVVKYANGTSKKVVF
jgi:hypothetical protein